jgi:DedD protein
MPDQPVREIQLGGKQLVFLFMASVVLAVAIFLLGISVGRGVHSAEGPVSGTDVAVSGESGVTPLPDLPATETTPADSLYHEQLQSGTPQTAPVTAAAAPALAAPKATDEPSPVADDAGPAAAPKPGAAPAPAASKPAEPQPQKPDAKASTEAARAATPATAAAGTWFVTVDSFRSRENADRQAARLKGKNYAAAVTSSAGLYRVRVGPFAQRADAERVRQRLQREEGLKPSISR